MPPDESAADTAQLLRTVAGWRLPPDKWPAVAAAIDALLRAQPDTHRATLGGLEALAPLRISTRVTNLSPAPAAVRERVDRYLRTVEPDRQSTPRPKETDDRPTG
jgi:hypothetical protein